MIKLKSSFLITAFLALAGIATEHVIESSITKQVPDLSALESGLAAGAAEVKTPSPVSSPDVLTSRPINMTYKTILDAIPGIPFVKQLTMDVLGSNNFTAGGGLFLHQSPLHARALHP